MGSLASLLCRPLLVVGLLVAPAGAWAAESPLVLIRTTVEQTKAVLDSRTPSNHEQSIAQVRQILLPRFDQEEVARRAMGLHWKKLNEAQRKQFIGLFVDLVEKTYSADLDRYSPDVKFSFDQERIEGNFAQVDTRVFDPVQNQSFTVNYRLRRVNGQWLIYDVVAENISMVRNYRNQFHRILNRSSYEDLVQKIESKLKELSTPSSSS
jgi:phospholipid transport system substrate-binding protein